MTRLLARLDAWIDRWLLGGTDLGTWTSVSYGRATGPELVADYERGWRDRL